MAASASVVRASSDIVTLKATKYRNIRKRYSLSAFYPFYEAKPSFKSSGFLCSKLRIKAQENEAG
jgi:hypothetical protein